jgi:protein required for attachment to host cells
MSGKVVWVLVADSASARLFRADRSSRRLELLREETHAAIRAKVSELMADHEGRSFESDHQGSRHGMQPASDPKRAEKHRFAVQLAAELEAAIERQEVDRLVLIAPPLMLGELREALPEQARARVVGELDKDLAPFPAHELEERLALTLWG